MKGGCEGEILFGVDCGLDLAGLEHKVNGLLGKGGCQESMCRAVWVRVSWEGTQS